MSDFDLKPIGNAVISHLRPAKISRFLFGAPYYPEHWDEETRKLDPERMTAAGFNVVRLAEFAWDIMEPSEGKFDFSFFDKIIRQLAGKGIDTILCTPTATPPRWLTLKHPEIQRVNAHGARMTHGSRQHCCHTNGIFRKYSRRISYEMAKHFRKNPNVVGWQTDNEINCHFSECHCEACQDEFRKFLAHKYANNIKLLNETWGTSFWALTYDSFAAINTPRRNFPTYPNPAAMLDYSRFLSFSVSRFQHEQVKILRGARPEWFITHNGLMGNIDYRGLFTKDLDFLGYDVYPMFCSDHKMRPHNHALGLDNARGLSGNFIIPEHQSGPGGQEPYFHDNPEPGEVRAMTYRSIARGCDGILYFRWRTCRFGAEEYWCGILDHDNVPRRRYHEISQIGKEMKLVGPEILGTSVHVDCAVASDDLEINTAHHSYPMGLPSPHEMAGISHKFFFDRGFAIGCVHPEDNLSGLKLYIIPQWVNFNPDWVPSLEKFVNNGGVLVIGARTATKDISNNVIPETIPGCLRKLAGITVEEYGKINKPEQRPFSFSFKNKKIPAEIWHEIINPEKSDLFAKWSGRHLDGKAAATIKKIGKGHVIYVGTYITGNVINLIGDEIAKIAKLKPIWNVPKNVETVLRYNKHNKQRKIWFFINDNDSRIKLSKTPKGLNLVSGKKNSGGALTLERYGIAVIKEE